MNPVSLLNGGKDQHVFLQQLSEGPSLAYISDTCGNFPGLVLSK